MSNLITIPKITWGASWANTLNFGWPIDRPVAHSLPRKGSKWTRTPGGTTDGWSLGDDQILEVDIRYIYTADSTSPLGNAQTGWDGATGFQAFLEWARIGGNVLRWFPDKTSGTYIPCYLDGPLQDPPASEQDFTRKVRLVLRSTDGTKFAGYGA